MQLFIVELGGVEHPAAEAVADCNDVPVAACRGVERGVLDLVLVAEGDQGTVLDVTHLRVVAVAALEVGEELTELGLHVDSPPFLVAEIEVASIFFNDLHANPHKDSRIERVAETVPFVEFAAEGLVAGSGEVGADAVFAGGVGGFELTEEFVGVFQHDDDLAVNIFLAVVAHGIFAVRISDG